MIYLRPPGLFDPDFDCLPVDELSVRKRKRFGENTEKTVYPSTNGPIKTLAGGTHGPENLDR
jgi:hypothetical protein